MKIAAARLYRQIQPFADGPYVCRGHTEEGFDSAIVALEAEDGTTGWGEAAPLGAFYAEAFPEAIRAGITRLLPDIVGQHADAPARLADHLNDLMIGQPAVKAAVDMAAWDLTARLAGQPLSGLLGGADGDAVPLYRSISQDDPAVMADQAVAFVNQGYRRLQVKVGGAAQVDVARLHAVRDAVGEDVVLYADANGAWRVDDALRFVHGIGPVDVVLEQPCMRLADNTQVSRRCSRPLVLDEGIVSLDDLLRAHEAGILAGVTLKMARVGGVGPTRLLRDIAVKLGLKVTIEDTGGSTINTAATAHMMVSTPHALRVHTVDFMNWVTVSNADGMPAAGDGMLVAPTGTGLGVTPDMAILGPVIAES